jgi:hypothetical protein
MATRSVVDSKRLIYRDHLAGELDAGSPGSDGASPYPSFALTAPALRAWLRSACPSGTKAERHEGGNMAVIDH